MSSERIPPQNLEAEQSVLGALLIDKAAFDKIAEVVTAEDFYDERHRIIFSAMRDLYTDNSPIDILALSNRLETHKELERVGGRSYLIHLSTLVPTAAHLVHYGEIVQRKGTLRRLITAAAEIGELGFREEEEVDTVLDSAEQKLFQVSRKFLRQSFTPLKEALETAWERIEELHRERGKLRGVPTGYTDLDNMLAGLQPSDLVILAARPSLGKTSLALDIARNAALEHGVSVGIFSLEMSKDQLVDRVLASAAGIDLWKMRTGKLSEHREDGQLSDFDRINEALERLSRAPIYFDDSASANVMEIRTKARRLKVEHGVGMLIIDYLQLMEGRGTDEGRVQELAAITRALKGLARELSVPILALSQLSRATEARTPAIPKLADLRDSGTIEQDADVVMFIYRKAMDRGIRELSPQERRIAEIHIAKHRNGPTGVVQLYFDEERVTFRNLEKKRTAAEVVEAPF